MITQDKAGAVVLRLGDLDPTAIRAAVKDEATTRRMPDVLGRAAGAAARGAAAWAG